MRALLKSLGRGALWTLLGTVSCACLAVAIALLLLTTRAGGSFVARRVLTLVNHGLRGRLELDGAQIFPNGRFHIRGAGIFGEDGLRIAGADELSGRIDLAALLRSEVNIQGLELRGGSLELRQDLEGDLNLATALSPRVPSPPTAAPSTAPGWHVAIDVSRLEASRFAYLLLPGPTPLLEVKNTSAQGRFELRRDGSVHLQSRLERSRWDEPVALPLQGEADLEIGTGKLHGEAQIRSGVDGEPSLVAELSLKNEILSLTVKTQAVDLATLRAELPHSRLTLDASASGPFRAADDLRLALAMTVRDSTLEGVPFEASVHATAVSTPGDRQLRLEELGLRLPGASLVAAGTIAPASLDLTSKVVVADSMLLTRALSHIPTLAMPPISGRLTTDLEVAGSLASPRLTARIVTPGLGVAGVHTGPVQISTQLSFAQNFERILVHTLRLGVPSGQWTLRDPAEISLHHGVRVTSFELDSEPQTLRAQLSITGETIAAEAEISGLDLARLPATWLPHALALEGVVGAQIDYQRRGGRDALQGQLSVHQGSVHGLKISSAAAQVDLKDGHLTGKLSAQTSAGILEAQVEAPARWPLGATDAPISAKAEAKDLQISELRPLLPDLSAWDGRVDLVLTLSGSRRRPRVTLLAKGHEIGGPWVPSPGAGAPATGDRLNVNLSSTWEQALTAQLDVSRVAATQPLLEVKGELGLSVQRILGGQRSGQPSKSVGASFSAAPLSLQIESATLDLRETAGLWLPKGLSGNASVSGRVTGSLASPRGSVRLQGEGLAMDRYDLGKLALEIVGDDRSLRATGALTSSEGSLALQASLAGPPETWRVPSTALAAPVELHVTLSGVPFWTLLHAPETYKGLLTGRADLDGSLKAPRATAELRLEGAQVGTNSLGESSLDLSWEGSRLRGALVALQPSGGKITAEIGLPLALGAQPANRDLRGNLLAQNFELAPLTQAAPAIHQVTGLLDAQVEASGTLESPVLTGALSVNEGSLAVAGFGLFNDIVLAASLSKNVYTLDRLTLRSGRGTASMSGSLTPTDQGFRLQARVDSQRFALYAADRLMAHLTTGVDVKGVLGDGRDQIDLLVTSAEIEIPSLTPKSLGAVSLDSDIVMTDGKKKEPAGTPMPLLIHLLAPGPLIVTGPDLTLHGHADLWARLDPDLVLKGKVAVTSGGISLFGRTFVVHEASAAFGDPPNDAYGALGDPLLSVRASQEANGTKIVARVNGRLPDPDISLTSDPAMSEEQIIALLLGGAPSSGDQQSGALSPLTNVLVNQALGSTVPVDSLSVSATHVEAGKQIGAQLYVSGAYNNDPDPRANQFEARLSYRLSKSWTVDGKYGTSGAGAVNVEWKTDW